jgi:hypothetical protein
MEGQTGHAGGAWRGVMGKQDVESFQPKYGAINEILQVRAQNASNTAFNHFLKGNNHEKKRRRH